MDNYFHETPRVTQPMPDTDGTIYTFHRTLTTYFRSFRETGFVVEEVVEPYPSKEVIQQIPGFQNDLRMSHFIVFRLRKRKSDG